MKFVPFNPEFNANMITRAGRGMPLLPPGVGLPGLPFMAAPGLTVARFVGDMNRVVRAGAVAPGVSGNGVADINNVNLGPNELRALDNLMQHYLRDNKFTRGELRQYQAWRFYFARGGKAPTNPPAPPPTRTNNPVGGGVPTLPGGSSTPPTGGSATPPAGGAWQVNNRPIDGRNFRSWGDPHEVTGDNNQFDNMKQGTFVKLRSASGDFELQTVQDKDKSGRWPGATLNHKAAVKDGNNVVIYDGLQKTLQVNGQNVAVPANGQKIDLPGGGKVEGTSDGLRITSAKGDVVNIHQHQAYIDVSGSVSASRCDGEIRGSLGAFDAGTDKNNDLMGRTGNTPMGLSSDPKALDAFIEEWRVRPGEDLFAPKTNNPVGGAVPGTSGVQSAAEAEFARLDVTQNGYLSGTEITSELRMAFPLKDRITKEDFVQWKVGQAEAAARKADEEEFARRDVNKDGQLDGNEVGADARYDKGNNWRRPDGTTQTELSKEEFLAGRAADRAAKTANPVGGAAAPAAPAPAAPAPAAEAAAPVKKAKRKKRKRGFKLKLGKVLRKGFGLAGKAFMIHNQLAFNMLMKPLKVAAATTGGALNIATTAVTGGNVANAVGQAATNVVKAHDPFDGIKL